MERSSLISLALPLLAAASGFLGGYYVRGPSTELVEAVETQSMQLSAFRKELSQLQSRQRVELAAFDACKQIATSRPEPNDSGATDPQPAASAAAEPEPPSPESEEALERGRALIVEALRTGQWTEANVLALRPIVQELDAEQQHDLLAELSRHINDSKLKLEGLGPPF